ncbi:MAG: D-alanyl-D-alanine carboxypeptidase [Clostridia bacterium]|nr:D-alanyl-D-alanine carboxypeptidase [Clostridia bacterium]
MKKLVFLSIFTLFTAVLCIFNSDLNVSAIQEEVLPKGSISVGCSGSSAFVFDADSGRVFYEKNADAKRAMASTTKIATAITVIENCDDLDAIVKIDKRAVGIEGTSIYLRAGEELSVRDLLYGLMLRSGNDAACALAIYTAGSIDEFCLLMEETAKKAGAENTSFANPHGLDAEEHYTTARDLAKITAYALKNEDFAQIVATKNIKIPSSEEGMRFLANKNRLLNSLEGCIGVKTGYTGDAGRCLVSAVERDGLKVVCVVLNCGPMFEESASMLNAVCEKYSSYQILEPYQYIRDIPLENGEVGSIQVFSKSGLKLALTEEERLNINIIYDLPEKLVAPVKSEQEIGKVEVYYGKRLIFSEKIYTIGEVDSKLLRDKVKDIIDHWGVN